jgi:hypothetical protein
MLYLSSLSHGVVMCVQGCTGMAPAPRSRVSRDGRPLRPGELNRACLSLSGQVYLVASGLSPSSPRGQDGGEVERCSVQWKEKGVVMTGCVCVWPRACLA